MRYKQLKIPSEFLPFDTHVTDADEVINVRDQYTFRMNHNILLAQRVRKDLVSQSCANTGTTPVHSFWTFIPRISADGETRSRLLSVPLYVTQFTKSITFWCVACKSDLDPLTSLAEDPELYVVLHEPQVNPFMPLSTYSMTISAAHNTPTSYSVSVDMPALAGEYSQYYGRVPMMMDIYSKSYIDDTNTLVSGGAVIDASNDWFVGSAAVYSSVATSGNVVYIDSTTYAEPRQIVNTVPVGSNRRYFLDVPWTTVPSTSHTLTVREILGIDMYSYGAYENTRTDLYHS